MRLFRYLILLIFPLVPLHLLSQTYVNREWVKNHSAPDSIEWLASTTDGYGNLITAGNTLVSGQHANILVTKLDENGQITWQRNWNGPKGKSDYGAAVITDGNQNVYVAGASQYSNDSIFDIVLLKFDHQGNFIWVAPYDATGGADYPVEMAIDNSGNVYITGASEGLSTGLDCITLKYNGSGNLQWATRYDYNQHLDIGADIVVSGSGEEITVTGGSEDTLGIWDYTTLSYNHLGQQTAVNRESSDETDIRKPKDLVKDPYKNYYITGIDDNGSDHDIKLLKLDSTLQSQWVSVYDRYNEGSNALGLDDDGNLYVGGWQEPEPGIRKFLLLKFDDRGSLVWEQTLWPDETKPLAEITDLQIMHNEVVNVVGYTSDGSNSNIVTAQFTTEGELQWMKNWENTDRSIEYPSSIQQIDDDIYVSGRTSNSAGAPQWVTLKYSFFQRDTALVYTAQGEPVFSKNELIVRFDTSLVKRGAVDNTAGKEAEFGELSYFLKAEVVDSIQQKLGPLCGSGGSCNITVLKIFRHLKTEHTHTLSRLGETIPIPPFWATFVLTFPAGLDVTHVADSLNSLFPLVKYAHGNYVAQPSATANDTLYPDQYALYPNTTYPNSSINIEPAWDYTAGQPYIKAGVFDTGIDYAHEDFGGRLNSKVVDGWDHLNNVPMNSGPGDPGGHGTQCAGVLGAIRNNNIGIAGVAGGNDSIGSIGVSLYSHRILPQPNGSVFNYIAEAIVESAIDSSTLPYGFGLHIANHSWGINQNSHSIPPLSIFNDTNITLLRESVHFANRAKVTFVAARGNHGNAFDEYPATLDESWILCISATDTSGNFAAYSSYGQGVDIAAPGVGKLVVTTIPNDLYQSFLGTSASTPYAAGLAGLLMSYLNEPVPAYNNLAPEDVEYILQMTATDTDLPGVDNLTGHGRINAGAALAAVDTAFRKLRHYGTDAFPYSLSTSLYSSNRAVKTPERFRGANGVYYPASEYKVDAYEIRATVQHNLAAHDSIVAAWPRPSSSNVLPLYDNSNNLLPRERVTLDSLDQNNAYLRGYVYRVSDQGGNYLGWWPFDTATVNPQFAYSILYEPNPSIKARKLYLKEVKISLFPNPASQWQSLKLEKLDGQPLEIVLLDLSGRVIREIYTDKNPGHHRQIEVDVSTLKAGLYLYRISLNDQVKYLKTIKL